MVSPDCLPEPARSPKIARLPAPPGPASLPEYPLSDLVLWLEDLRMTDLGKVGGKNASLGEMIGNLAKLGVSVPGGFATTAQAFQSYLEQSGLARRIQDRLATLDRAHLRRHAAQLLRAHTHEQAGEMLQQIVATMAPACTSHASQPVIPAR